MIELTTSGCEGKAVGNLTPPRTPHVNETESGCHTNVSLTRRPIDLILIKFTVLLYFLLMVNSPPHNYSLV